LAMTLQSTQPNELRFGSRAEMKPLISKKAIYELQEHFVGTTLRTIEQECDAVDIRHDASFSPAVGGQRRTLFQQYMHSLDLTKPKDVRKLLNLFASILSELEAAKSTTDAFNHDYAVKTFDLLCRLLQRDGYRYENGQISAAGRETALDELQDAISPLDAPHLQEQIDRMRAAADDDPSLAIGTAKELVETVCKTILRERSVSTSASPEIPELIKATREALHLMPDQIPANAKAADTIRRLLSNLGTIAQNLAEIRRDYGTGHGRDGKAKGLEPRHARLAVNSAVALVTFLIETHQGRDQSTPQTTSRAMI
ncbi:MAG: abortive infection family protein, partial [Terracidiphilus sp.]